MKFTELKLSKKDLDKFSEYLDSDDFRNFGYGHMKLDSGEMLLVECDELVKNREDFKKYLIDKGLDQSEINKQFESKEE